MLNLLPPELKESRRVKSLVGTTVLAYIGILAVVGLSIAGMMTWTFIQQSEISDKQSQIQQLSSQRRAKEEVVTKASFVEDRLKTAGSYRETRQWENILNEIALATPTDTKLSSIRAAAQKDDPTIIDLTISGTTSDRRSIVLFRDKLEETETITKTTILSLSELSVGSAKEFTFSLSGTYQQPAKKGSQ